MLSLAKISFGGKKGEKVQDIFERLSPCVDDPVFCDLHLMVCMAGGAREPALPCDPFPAG